MNSAKAHGFLIAGLINDHLLGWLDAGYVLEYGLDEATAYCPRCCGPCAALAEYFNTGRGRAEADAYAMALPKSHRPGHGYDWQLENGAVNWDVIEEWMKLGWCPNHDDALHQQGQSREKFSE
jgi:hypothetical protein